MTVGDETSKRLYETYYMKVYSYVMTLSKSKHMAEEITQETFYRTITSSSAFHGDSGEYTWLCAIAKNLYYDEMRKRRHQADVPLDEEIESETDVEKQAADADMSFRIHQCLHALGEPYKEVFELRVFGELSFRQIGTIFGKTENWARVTYHRARLKIQERMAES